MTAEATEKPKKPRDASPETTEDGFVRLHITPFDADLLKIVVPAATLPNARNISYHSIETFPEKRFGFVELPQVDADKIKKKLNGTVLKGSKMRIEKARPEKRIEPASADETGKTGKKSKKTKNEDNTDQPKKRKREMGVVDGVMLDDRKVKRGWTEPAEYKNKKKSKDNARDPKSAEKESKRKQSRSKYIEKEECLLKTRMPPNEMCNLPDEGSSTKKKKKKGSSRQITVHEFEKTTKFMSFLRSAAPETDSKPATEFVGGKGWVDEDGNVVEAVKEKEKPRSQPKKKTKKAQIAPAETESEDDSTSESETSSDDTSSEDESEDESMEEVERRKNQRVAANAKDESSDSDTSESDTEVSGDDESPTPTPEKPVSTTSKPLMIDIPPPPTTPKAVHPLEALYKRSKVDDNGATTPGAEKKGGFSFFGGEGDEDEEEGDAVASGIPAIPMTPYTKQDFEWRNVRSAAPTPDTVHPARMRSFFPSADDDAEMAEVQEDEEDGYDEDGADEDAGAPSSQQGTSDFQKWFWENRRDLNRSWMTRRKTAAKEKRHRDNKARASKAA
ncbi:MFS transporter [Cordyceps javanica]|uniref:MFS transporter n=1 Tax=Cordyceps javanica TaxID=43265 RepID=A0A545W5C4_9HYPO|nr:MFS transporter [Cordyceps javanica]TQW09085.1 MFS transporter [Cordyceps javanica]